MPHLGGDLGHPLHDPPRDGSHLRSDVAQPTVRDVLGQVAAAFEFREDQQDPDQSPEVAARIVARLEARPDVELHLGGHRRRSPVSVDDGLSEFGVPVQEGVGGAGQRFTHEPEQTEDGLLDNLRHGRTRYPAYAGRFTLRSQNDKETVTESEPVDPLGTASP